MDDIVQRVAEAQQNPADAEALLQAFLPFVRAQAARFAGMGVEQDDLVSVGMLAFLAAVRQYEAKRGPFVGFAQMVLRSRMVDEIRREGRRTLDVVPYVTEGQEGYVVSGAEIEAALQQYDVEQERQILAEEIAALRQKMGEYGLEFEGLARCCPKQTRSRRLCLKMAREVVSDPAFCQQFTSRQQLATAALAARMGVSGKTVEKHRKYISTLVVVLLGEYPGIAAFVTGVEEASE